MDCRFLEVPGHLFEWEGEQLQKLAENKCVLDIGTHNGRSACAMAPSARFVVTVDHYQGDSMIGGTSLDYARGHIAKVGLDHKIAMIEADWSQIVTPQFLSKFDFVFYDAAHTPPLYEKQFLDRCFLVPQLPIALHDYKPREPNLSYVVSAIRQFSLSTRREMQGPVGSVVWFDSILPE